MGIPKASNKSLIMVVADQLSKYAHFFALQHPFTLTSTCQIFLDHIFKLHGMPTSIILDRDPTFTSKFWQELFKLQGTQLKMSTSYHPQTDGSTKAFNKCLETYLGCFALEKKHQWTQLLPLEEWWYNTTYHEATKMTPCEEVYGQHPPYMVSYLLGTSKVNAMDSFLQNWEATLAPLKENDNDSESYEEIRKPT